MISIQPVKILLVEDNEGDIRLTREALKEGKVHNDLYVTRDGIDALKFLNRHGKYKDVPRPDLILLDLNLPKMDGRELLEKIKEDASLRRIPVVILTTSEDEADIIRSYELHANCYITKPVNMEQFIGVVRSVEDFWFSIVRLPCDG
jgi:CheY-like chemotaxis protein